MAEEVLLVLSTFPDVQTARQIARTLVEEQLAACGNIIPQIESVYRWKGAVESNPETLALFKTTVGKYQMLEDRLRSLHPYEVPEVLSFSPTSGLPAYLNWVVESCNG